MTEPHPLDIAEFLTLSPALRVAAWRRQPPREGSRANSQVASLRAPLLKSRLVPSRLSDRIAPNAIGREQAAQAIGE
jgi:hypothetical protein